MMKFSWFILPIVAAIHFQSVAACEEFGQEGKELAAYEKEIVEHPLEAISIARRGSALFAGQEKHLFELAARQQEKKLAELSLAQAFELAEVIEKKLQGPAEANHVRSSWLALRGLGLSQEDVRRFLGLPQKISSQILYCRQLELWSYEHPAGVWLTFICTKNHTPTLHSVRSTFK